MQAWRYPGKAIFSLLLLLIVVDAAYAQQPDPSKWGREVLGKGTIKSTLLTEFVVIGAVEGEESEVPSFVAGFDTTSFMKALPPADIGFLANLNRRRLEETEISPEIVAQATGAQFVLNTAGSAIWTLGRRQDSGIRSLFKAAPPKDKEDNAAVADWILEQQGFDGVVLAQQDTVLLVGSTSKKLKPSKLQAVAIKNSRDLFIVSKSNRKDTEGLFSLEKKSGPFATFRVKFISSESDLGPGTKLIFEKEK